MNKDEQIKEISKQIHSIVTDIINKQTDTKYKDAFESLKCQVQMMINNADAIIEEFDDSNLTINKIETEGYRRCLYIIKEMIDNEL
jgi:seryl-tRNA synthetase